MNIQPTLSLAIPLYNEEETVRLLVSNLSAEFDKAGLVCELVLVNNGSRDRTPVILEELSHEFPHVRVVTVGVNQGYGWGILCGLKETSAPIVGYMCGDGQILPADVVRVYLCLTSNPLDIAKVNRVARHDGLQRKIMSQVYNTLFELMFHVGIRDINGTPKLMFRKCYEAMRLQSKDWFIDAEVLLKARQLKYRIGEVDIEFKPRVGGESTVRWTITLEFIKNMIRYRLNPDSFMG